MKITQNFSTNNKSQPFVRIKPKSKVCQLKTSLQLSNQITHLSHSMKDDDL